MKYAELYFQTSRRFFIKNYIILFSELLTQLVAKCQNIAFKGKFMAVTFTDLTINIFIITTCKFASYHRGRKFNEWKSIKKDKFDANKLQNL